MSKNINDPDLDLTDTDSQEEKRIDNIRTVQSLQIVIDKHLTFCTPCNVYILKKKWERHLEKKSHAINEKSLEVELKKMRLETSKST
jgi:hypothetical protein